MKDSAAIVKEVVDDFLKTAAKGAFQHVTQDYTGSKTAPGLAICLVACPDVIAKQLHVEFDELVRRTFAQHGLKPQQMQ
jgi:hypothetical protein